MRAAEKIRVSVAAEAVRAFRRETGWQETGVDQPDGPPPAAFPAVWLRQPELKALLRAAAPAGMIPVHEAQKFSYVRPLDIGGDYDLVVDVLRETAPDRLAARAKILTLEGAPVGDMVVTLRLFATAEALP